MYNRSIKRGYTARPTPAALCPQTTKNTPTKVGGVTRKEKSAMKTDLSQDIRYVGVDDLRIDLFEGQYLVPDGMSYNSYVILDEKVAVMDTVDARFGEEWLANLDRALEGRIPDYLVIQHMEPDHSANLLRFADAYPAAVIVATDKAFRMMGQFFGRDFADRRLVVGEGDCLPLGRHTLSFVLAPMVHWPEVMVTYETSEKLLFSADAFGRFGVPDAAVDWATEARRYYIGIVGKYGVQVQALLKKAAALDIRTICPLHGPCLSGDDLAKAWQLYDLWSSYTPEAEGVVIAYASIYGHTAEAAKRLADRLRADGCHAVVLYDLARCDKAAAVADAFRYDRLALASVTYNADLFPPMRSFLSALVERGFKRRRVAFIECGTWAPQAAKCMRAAFEKSPDLTFCENTVKIFSALNAANEAQIAALSAELCHKD